MATEIEHKFLVKNNSYREMATSFCGIKQGYLCRDPERTVRVRVRGDKGYLTVKGKNVGASRLEFEYEIAADDAEKLLGMCPPPILEKTRYLVPFKGHTWEVDEFSGVRNGLITAEIELASEDEPYEKPDFLGEDLTGNPAYCNSNL